jgi:hypothetical protein
MLKTITNGCRCKGVSCLSMLLVVWASAVHAKLLSPYLWENRVLLIFAPANPDVRTLQLTNHLTKRNCEIVDRDIIIGKFALNEPGWLNGKPVELNQSAELRTKYSIEDSRFAVLLIGKDGGEKYRLYEVPELDEIFALIDGMPMRQAEMQENPNNCKDSPSAD